MRVLILLLTALSATFADDLKEDRKLRREYSRLAEQQRDTVRHAQQFNDHWQKLCLGRKMVIGFDQFQQPSCVAPPAPAPVKAVEPPKEAGK